MVISTVGKKIYKTITEKKNKPKIDKSTYARPINGKPGTRMQGPKPKPTKKPKRTGY